MVSALDLGSRDNVVIGPTLTTKLELFFGRPLLNSLIMAVNNQLVCSHQLGI